MNMHMLLPKNL